MGFLDNQADEHYRETRPSIPSRDLQSAQSCELQYAQPDHVYTNRRFGDGGCNYQHFDVSAADPVWRETALVGSGLLCEDGESVAKHGFEGPALAVSGNGCYRFFCERPLITQIR